MNVPRRAQHIHNAWKKHLEAVYWVDINLAIEKRLTFYQTRSNEIILQETLPANCIPKVVRMETGEVIYEKVYMSLGLPPKVSFKHEWKRELRSEHAQRSEVGQLSGSFQLNQPILNPNRERTVRPVIRDDARTVQDGRKTSRSQEIDVNSFHEESVSSERTERSVVETSVVQARSSEDSKDPNVGKAHERTTQKMCQIVLKHVLFMKAKHTTLETTLRERTVRPVVDHDNLVHEQTMVNEANMDFRIPGRPHSVVKHAQNTSVRELIKLQNHQD